ncbi:MAG TPA: tetratricopeptide repeat protein [Pseudonocardiaceae bacterium]|nr:tetratricopeptide repeat protein [Pseudonocardiaceae bacterium]
MAVRATHIRVLGPFELVHDGQVVPLAGRVGQAILTALASQPDTKMQPAQLISMVWGESDAASADTLYHHVARLRRALAPVGLEIVGHRPGYRLPIGAEQVDVVRFDELLRTARALSATDPDEAAQRLRAAVALWRGPSAVDSLTLPGIRRLAAGWQARRLDAEEDLAEIDLRRGRPDQALDRLHALVAAHPDRPRLAAALVRALAATGRVDQARAVLAEADRTARRTGGTVHPALVQARQELSGPGIERPDPVTSAAAVLPFQLPADTVRFTGRAEHLTRLLELSPGAEHPGGPATVVVTAVEGMAGIGKTALAVHAAHRLADRFPDGVLFTDLHGYTPRTEPTPPEQALDHLLRGLGVPGPQIPPDLDARVGLYRSVLARRQVLIVLDNAAHEGQLQPLLPAAPGCRAIVTSRRHLAGLDDAAHLSLPVLDPTEAADLFRGLAGDRATPADQATIERIVALCGHLPLAIRITAARLRQAATATATTVCAELAEALDTGSGLEWLSDGHRAVTTALAVSYRHLTADQRHALRLAGLHPGPSIEPYALAALADTTVDHARQLLDQLHAASLLDQPAHRRYTRHDLVAAYAATLAADLPEPDRHTALDRLYDHYAATSSRAMDLTHPWEADQRPHPPTTHSPAPTLSDREQAQAWLDNETDNLLATAHHATAGLRADHTMHQSTTLRRHLRTRGHYSRATLLHQHALDSAHQAGNDTAEQEALVGLGNVHRLQGRHDLATDCLERALAGAHRTGNRTTEHEALRGLAYVHYLQGRYGPTATCFARALGIARRTGNHAAEQEALRGLGYVHYVQGRYAPAADCFAQALDSARRTGNRAGEQEALCGLGTVHYLQGEYGPATDCLEHALAIAHQTGDRAAEQDALCGLGDVHRMQGKYEQATDCFEQALDSGRRTGNRAAEQEALRGLGIVHYLRGRYGPATECFEQALANARETGFRNGQYEAHQGLGRVHHATGDHERALHHHTTALRLAVDLDQPPDQARAHDGLAHTHQALDHPAEAHHHWQAALDLLTTIGTDNTEEPGVTTSAIRAHLSGRT